MGLREHGMVAYCPGLTDSSRKLDGDEWEPEHCRWMERHVRGTVVTYWLHGQAAAAAAAAAAAQKKKEEEEAAAAAAAPKDAAEQVCPEI